MGKWNLVGKMIELLIKFEEIAMRLSKRESIVSETIQILELLKNGSDLDTSTGIEMLLFDVGYLRLKSIETKCKQTIGNWR